MNIYIRILLIIVEIILGIVNSLIFVKGIKYSEKDWVLSLNLIAAIICISTGITLTFQ